MINGEMLRIIDANLNRSREGLRVCEEIARFMLDSRKLTEELKSVRHKISNIVKTFPVSSKKLFSSRDVEMDVGRRFKSRSEMARSDYADIFSANIERVKESLRVLEEFSKLIDRKTSIKFTNLRFNVYDIEKEAVRKISSLRHPRSRLSK